jgi:putative endonuclease
LIFIFAKLSFALMYYVYVLISEKDRQLYVGMTNSLKRRLREHFNGQVTATKSRLPLKFIYHEAYLKWSDAKRRETHLKGGNGRAQLKIQLQDILKELKYKHL